MKQIYKDLLESLDQYGKVALATVVKAQGSTPRTAGAKMLIFPDGTFRHTVGGGIFESLVIKDALEVLQNGKPVIKEYSFNLEGKNAIGAICGGYAEVLIEMITNTPELLIVGGGHVGNALARIASLLDFKITVLDDREDYVQLYQNDPHITGIKVGSDYSSLPTITENTFICLVTKGCPTDALALKQVIKSPAKYIGMIGSQKKVNTVYQNLKESGFDPSLFERVHAPIGINIGADSPEEIAISILAEIITIRNRK
jgi:xanthine dehydrogenase accessory factor